MKCVLLQSDDKLYVSCPEWIEVLTTTIYEMQQHGILCDIIIFDSHGNQILLHSVVLACCSTWWNSVFKEVG